MIATSHVIIGGAVGIAVGTVTQNPAVALFAGVASHLICDTIPHLDSPFPIQLENGQYDRPIFDKKFFAFALTDSIFAFLITLVLWIVYFDFAFFSPFAWAAFGAYLPDFLDNTPAWRDYFRKIPGFKQFHRFHVNTHNVWRFRFPMPQYWFLGTITQIAFVVPCLWYILNSN